MDVDTNFVTVVIRLPSDPAARKALVESFNFGSDRKYMGGECTAMSMGDVITEVERLEASEQ